MGGGRSPDPALFSQLLRPCPGPGSCPSSSPPWSPVPHRQPEGPCEHPPPLRALSQVLPVPHRPTTCLCHLSALVSPSFTLVVKPQGPCTGCSLLVAHSSPVSACGSLLPLSVVSGLLVNLFLTTPSEGGAPLAFCHKASQHVQLLEILLLILVFTTRMLGVYTPPPQDYQHHRPGLICPVCLWPTLSPARHLAPSLCSGTEQLFDDCFLCTPRGDPLQNSHFIDKRLRLREGSSSPGSRSGESSTRQQILTGKTIPIFRVCGLQVDTSDGTRHRINAQ